MDSKEVIEAAALEEFKKQIYKLQKENDVLKKLLEIKRGDETVRVQPSSERIICEFQIEILKQDALLRPLTLEEVKKLDLLVKNLNIIKEKDLKQDKTQLQDLEESKLLELVSLNGTTNKQ